MIEFLSEEIRWMLEEFENLWSEYGVEDIEKARAILNKIAMAFPEFASQVQEIQRQYLD